MKKSTESKVTVDHVMDGLNESYAQAQLRQVISTTYGKAQPESEFQENVFNDEDFGETQTFQENRIAWIKVPVGTTAEQVQSKIDANPQARIYKILSNDIILSNEQKVAMTSGLTSKTRQDYIESQMVRDNEGNQVFHNGKAQYSAKFFSVSGKADEDRRSGNIAEIASPSEVAKSSKLTAAEMESENIPV